MKLLGSVDMSVLSGIWETYKGDVIPVLVTIVVGLLTWLAIKIRSDAKLMKIKNELQIQALKEVANREDNKPQLDEQSVKLKELSNSVIYLAEMFNQAFQNSTIDPEIKEAIAACLNKIKYGSEEDLIKELENSKLLLEEQVHALMAQLDAKKQEVATQETKVRVRR